MSTFEEFNNIYSHGLARVAACTLPVASARPATNAARIIEAARAAEAEGAVLAAFPELSISGYALDDLFTQASLLEACTQALADAAAATANMNIAIVCGCPLKLGVRVYNCAVVLAEGKIAGIVPKTYIPNYGEFYEKRYFASAADLPCGEYDVCGELTPVGTDLLFCAPALGFTFGVEVCEDMWVPTPPANALALAGAQLIVNISGSPVTVGRNRERTALVQASSTRYLGAYLYTAAGAGESTTDLSWDGQAMIYERGQLLGASQRFAREGESTFADIDLAGIDAARIRSGSFGDNASAASHQCREVRIALTSPRNVHRLCRPLERFPFVPADEPLLDQDCYEAYNIQVHGLIGRLEAIGNPKLTIGVSGGLDSTHALIVAAQAMDALGRPRSDILAYTMPGFATSDGTKSNAYRLCEALGIPLQEIDIRPLAQQMLSDLGHQAAGGEAKYDVTYENVQAGLRTDILFRQANMNGAIVLGTGDLSELALGWCTFGVGDQMSHYNVNAGVPKTLIQHLIAWIVAGNHFGSEASRVLDDILHTEISPELVPTDGPLQSTQAKIGPYELQDFTLYYLLAGKRPRDIAFLQWQAWKDAASGHWPRGVDEHHAYTLADILHWMELFYRRFFANQFKRSTLPNGPKVHSGGTLSPRGDWRMPSDTSGAVWLEEIAELQAMLEAEPEARED